MRQMTGLLLAALVVSATPTLGDEATDRGKALIAKLKTFDEKHLGKKLFGVYVGGKYIGTGRVTVTKTEVNGISAYKVSVKMNVKFGDVFEVSADKELVCALDLSPISLSAKGVQKKGEQRESTVSSLTRGAKQWRHVQIKTVGEAAPVKTEKKIDLRKNLIADVIEMTFTRVLLGLEEGKLAKIEVLSGESGEVQLTSFLRKPGVDGLVRVEISHIKNDSGEVKKRAVQLDVKTGELRSLRFSDNPIVIKSIKPEQVGKDLVAAKGGTGPDDVVARYFTAGTAGDPDALSKTILPREFLFNALKSKRPDLTREEWDKTWAISGETIAKAFWKKATAAASRKPRMIPEAVFKALCKIEKSDDDSATVTFGKDEKPQFRFELKKHNGVWMITKQTKVEPTKK